MLVTAFCWPAENFSPSRLTKHVKESGLGLSEASLLSTVITNRLRDFKTSVEEDSGILDNLKHRSNPQIPHGVSRIRYEMALQVRKGEKEILQQILQLTQSFVAECTNQMAGESAKRKRPENGTAVANKKKAARK
jgi:Rubisco LSMT substrate-binding